MTAVCREPQAEAATLDASIAARAMVFSAMSIKRMLAFHRVYPDPIAIGQPPVAQLPATAKVPQPVAKLPAPVLRSVPSAHRVILVDKDPDLPTSRWYVKQTPASGWSRNVLGKRRKR